VFRQGDTPQDVFLVSDGLVILKCNVADGREAVLTVRFPGQVLDCCCHDLGVPYLVSACTVLTSTLIRVPVTEFRSRIAESRDAWDLFGQLACIDAYNATTSVVALKMAPPACRFVRFLRHFASATGQASELRQAGIRIPLRDSQLAGIIGLSVRQFARVKRQLQRSGRILVKGASRVVLRRAHDQA
jgi:CRP-like cAMP-binding protein